MYKILLMIFLRAVFGTGIVILSWAPISTAAPDAAIIIGGFLLVFGSIGFCDFDEFKKAVWE